MSIHFFALSIPYIPLVISIGYALLQYKRLTNDNKWFAWFVSSVFLMQVLSSYLSSQGWNNMPVLHLYTLVVGVFLFEYYARNLSAVLESRILRIGLLVFIVGSVLNSLFVQNIYSFNSYALTGFSIIMVILSLSTFILSQDIELENDEDWTGFRWINSGLFVFHTSNIVLFYFGDIIMDRTFPNQIGKLAMLPHSFFSTVMYTCFSIGIWKSPKQ